MAILWLVPFDSIQLAISLPIDLKFDRLVLPFIFATWVLALCTGGPDAPRLRMTSIHLAVAAFVAVAALSVVLDATNLNQSLELDTSLKKLPLLISYLSIFVMTASVVRRTEVQAFFTYTLGLAVLCSARHDLGVPVRQQPVLRLVGQAAARRLPDRRRRHAAGTWAAGA